MCIECNHHLVLPLLWHRFAKKVKSFQCTTFWPFGDPSIHKSQYDTNAETNCLWYGPHGQLVRRTHTVWPVFLSSLTTQFHHLERILKMLWEFNINIRFCILQINNIIYIYIIWSVRDNSHGRLHGWKYLTENPVWVEKRHICLGKPWQNVDPYSNLQLISRYSHISACFVPSILVCSLGKISHAISSHSTSHGLVSLFFRVINLTLHSCRRNLTFCRIINH